MATFTWLIYVAPLAIGTLAFLAGMGFFSSGNKFEVEGKTILITGGSQGMGRGLAKLLAEKGANVVIVARNKEKLASALKYISTAAKSPSQRFHIISADVTSASENARILSEATAWNNGTIPDIVWANAGGSKPALFVDTSLETLRSQFEINYWATAYLAHETLRAWLRPSSPASTSTSPSSSSPRQFIMTSSSVAYVGIAGYAPYAPAKAALRSLADCLRSEVNLYNGARRGTHSASALPPSDINIRIVLPGTILSPGLVEENKTKHPVTGILEEGDPKQSEDEVAAAAIKGLENGDFMVTTQFLGDAMKSAAMAGSPRRRWVLDTLFSCLAAFIWLFVGPDLERKVWNYGKENGLVSKR